jgi:hypothetical protein
MRIPYPERSLRTQSYSKYEQLVITTLYHSSRGNPAIAGLRIRGLHLKVGLGRRGLRGGFGANGPIVGRKLIRLARRLFFFQFDFQHLALKLALEIVTHLPELHHVLGDLPGDPRQLLGTEDHKGQQQNEENVGHEKA